VETLDEYDTIVSYEEGTLVNPTIIRYDRDSLLYIYDAEKHQVLALDGSDKSNVNMETRDADRENFYW